MENFLFMRRNTRGSCMNFGRALVCVVYASATPTVATMHYMRCCMTVFATAKHQLQQHFKSKNWHTTYRDLREFFNRIKKTNHDNIQ